MSETAEDDEGYVDEEALEAAVPRRQTPLLPEAGASGTPLMIVIAVLAFIASVSLAGYFMVSRAAADWTGDLSGTITVQVRGAAADLILQDADIAEGLLRDHPGVTEVARMSRAETEELLEPWLGRDNLSADIPIPIIITAEISPSLRRDLSSLRNGLAEAAPLAALDDHGQWNDRLVDAANRAKGLAFIVFAMIMGATACVIIFATRAGLAANREIVEVMHLVGATDKFIADQVQRRYFSLGLRGGAIGAFSAAMILFLTASFGAEDAGLFLPNLQAAPAMLAGLAIVPVVICGISSLVARITVRTILAREIH
ncbi:cell division protein FtsX [Parvularcula marina]|uniref:ABC transporter permease n=1 Tax=Parvularcula marina TaxID=2292771 RepID=A0A371RHY5_9PROT|nr:ABC transporter permease [Parvularcula marina]RFB05040.1 ABC transporter permease [Parvularcula marina]